MSDGVKRVMGAVALGLVWFVVVVIGGALGGHSQGAEAAVIVIALMICPTLCIMLMAVATDEADTFPAVVLWIAWCLAGVLGVVTLIGASDAYEWSYGRPQAVTVMATRCGPDSGDTGCAAQVRLSTVDTERDLGWLTDCEPRLARGQRAVVLTDPRGWFQPQLPSCAADGRWIGTVIVGSVGFAAALTLGHLVWAVAFAVRERRGFRRWRR